MKLWTSTHQLDQDCMILPVHWRFERQQPTTAVHLCPVHSRQVSSYSRIRFPRGSSRGVACLSGPSLSVHGECSSEVVRGLERVDAEACGSVEHTATAEAASFVVPLCAIDAIRESAEEEVCISPRLLAQQRRACACSATLWLLFEVVEKS